MNDTFLSKYAISLLDIPTCWVLNYSDVAVILVFAVAVIICFTQECNVACIEVTYCDRGLKQGSLMLV